MIARWQIRVRPPELNRREVGAITKDVMRGFKAWAEKQKQKDSHASAKTFPQTVVP